MPLLHKIIFNFENSRQATPLRNRLESELTGIANSLKNDFFQPSDIMRISSKLSRQEHIPAWEWYAKIAIDGAPGDFLRGAGTVAAADEMASRILAVIVADPFTTGTPVRIK